jgi:hypothetical protein
MSDEYDPTNLRLQSDEDDRLKRKAKTLSKVEQSDFVWLMNDKRGRRFIWLMLERTGVFRTSFTGNSTTFFNEGQRNIGLLLLDMINTYAPEQYLTALQERKKEVEHTSRNSFDRNDSQ